MSEQSESAPASLSLDDRRLVDRLRAGDSEAVGELERRFGHELRLFCRRMLGNLEKGEDVVQDVFCTCCTLSPESLPQRSLRGWLYQIARRRCIDIQRKGGGPPDARARAVRGVQPSMESAVDPLTTPSGKALKRDRALRVLALLDKLDEELRSVVVMHYFQELTREEIAEAIGLTVAGTKARLARAMSLLRDELQNFTDSGS